jgi:hypothetical protein
MNNNIEQLFFQLNNSFFIILGQSEDSNWIVSIRLNG